MSEPLLLSEYEDREVGLEVLDADFIARRLAKWIRIRRELSGARYVLNPQQFVGLVTLPSGLSIECRPKVPARNLLTMLALAFDLPDPFLDADTSVSTVQEVLELLVDRFAALVERRIDAGLHRAYVEVEDNLAMVRGRIAIAEDVRLNHVLRQRTYCRFSEYSWDVPDNRVLRQVVRLLSGWRLRPRLVRRLRHLDELMTEVTPGRYSAGDVERFVYTRLNADYRALHRLCRVFLENGSPSDESGEIAAEAFLLDMNRLFEAYVTAALSGNAPQRVDLRVQVRLPLDEGHTIDIRPDLLLKVEDRPWLVVECKYKRIDLAGPGLGDLYQVVTYCDVLATRAGVIVFPRHLGCAQPVLVTRSSGKRLHLLSIDLAGSREQMAAERARLAASVIAFAQEAAWF